MKMPTMRRRAARRQAGQAILELTLSLTLIVLFVAAAVDLGLAYKAYQTLINAASEASSYLDQNPVANCGPGACDALLAADTVARERFRTEQGGLLRSVASTLDLNANGIDDIDEVGGAAMIEAMIQIDEADNTQIDAVSGQTFAVGDSFDPAETDSQCQERIAEPASINAAVTSCYIVIRARMFYRPFVLRPVLGETMTIRAISVRRIIKTFN